MITCKAWKGDDLRGTWQVLRKLDGVRALVRRGRVVSRHGKPLYNLNRHAAYGHFTDAEVWLGSFKTTIQAVRTQSSVRVPHSAVYQLDPPDPRLHLCWTASPDARFIRTLLKRYRQPGEDGLVLRQGDRWLKVKHEETYDVRVTGVQPGRGKHAGRMGALLTAKGKVGTGFSDAERREMARRFATHVPTPRLAIIGKTIEVTCAALTTDGKFRHARFVRVREDR